MFNFAKKRHRCLSIFMLVIMICSMFPASIARADNSVDIDITDWDNWYVYDHYDVIGYDPSDSKPGDPLFSSIFGGSAADPGKRPYFPILENQDYQATTKGPISIPGLLSTGAWRTVHHLWEHISLVSVPKDGFDIYDIVFMGYGEEPYTDFLIYPETSGGEKSFGYDIYALNIDTHTLSSAGFLLNAGVDDEGFIHGYVLLIGFPDSYSGGTFDGARMYLYKILEPGETDSNGATSPGVKAADIHHPTEWAMGAFSNQGSNMKSNQLPAMDLAVDGRTVVLLDTDGDGNPDYLGFRQAGAAADSAIALIYDTAGSIIAQVMVDGQDIIIDNNGVMWFYDDKPFLLEDGRVSTMAMPMEMSIDDPFVTVVEAKVVIGGGPPTDIDGDKYVISRDGVSVRSDDPYDPGDPDSFWIGRPGGWNYASFVPGESKVWANGKEYVLDDDANYMEGNSLYVRDDSGAGQFESFWRDNYTFISGSVVLNNAPPVPYDPDVMWLEEISGFGYMLCVLQPNGLLKTYPVDGIHTYFTTDTLVELRYGNDSAGIMPGIYTLDGTEAYLENGYLYIRKNIHYNYIYIDGTTNYVMDGSKFRLKTGQIFETDGDNVKFQYGNLVVSGSRYTYTLHNWSEDTRPEVLKVQLINHEVLPAGIYELGTGGVEWYDGYLAAPVSLYVIDGEDLFIENGKDIYTDNGYLYIFPDGLDANEPGRVVIDSGKGSSAINETILLDGVYNYIKPDNTVHVAPRSDRYSFNSANLIQIGTLANPGEFFAPEGKRTSVLHIDVSFTDNDMTIISSVPGGASGISATASIKVNDGQSFQSDGTYRGFGPYVEYQSHGCSSLTSFRFSNMTMGAVPQHTLFFEKNADEAVEGDVTFKEVDEGGLIGDLPGIGTGAPTRPGYTFLGWAKKSYATTPDFDGNIERMGFDDITVYAVWEANPVEVVFWNTDPAAPTDDALYESYTEGNEANSDKHYGDKLTGFTAPDLWYDDVNDAYYIFLGWYLAPGEASDPGEPWDFAGDVISGDVTDSVDQLVLYARWRLVAGETFSLTFDENATDAVPGTTTSKTVEEAVPVGNLPSAESGDAPARPGYDFAGWATTTGATTPDFDEESSVTGDTKVYAVWKSKAKVTLDTDGGNFDTLVLDGDQFADNGIYKLPLEEPSNPGYKFTGWKIDGDTSGDVYDPGDVLEDIKTDITVVAQWEPLYTVTVDESYADPTGGGSYEAGETVTINAGNRSSEYVFLGWEVTSGTSVTLLDSKSKKTTFEMPFENVVIKAIWHELTESDYDFPAETCEVIFVASGGLPPTHIVEVEEGKPVAEPQDPQKEDYEFLGWFTEETGGELWDFETPVTGDTVLYAHWRDLRQSEPQAYVVRFDLQDGSELDEVTVEAGGLVTEPAPPEISGYKFKGWYTAPVGGSEWDFASDVIEHDRTLYAFWLVTVTFDAQNGTDTAAVDVEKDAPVSEPATDPVKSGYKFLGWFTGPAGGLEWDFNRAIDKSVTLYAHWEAIPSPVTVTFDLQDGSAPQAVTLAEGSTATEPAPPPVRSGYTFKGWFTGSAGGSQWDFETPITDDIALYAHWEDVQNPGAEMFNVTFDLQDGSHVTTATVAEGEQATEPAPPVRSGYIFKGWFTGQAGGTQWDFETPITDDVALYAHWEDVQNPGAEMFNVTFDLQDGSAPQTAAVSEGHAVEEPARPARHGYTFRGWFTEPDGSSEWNFSTAITEDIVLYAHWEKISNTVTVTFDSQGGSAVPAFNVEEGSSMAKPADPLRSGRKFLGWFTAASGGELWDFNKPIENAMTLYAHWSTSSDTSNNSGSSTPPAPSTPVTPVTPVAGVDDRGAPAADDEVEATSATNTVNNEATEPPPADRQQELSPSIILPQGAVMGDFPDMNLNAHQPDLTTPGGKDHNAPPVPNDSGDMLMPQLDEDGNIIFVEIFDLEGAPLGYWTWNEEDEMWVFIDNLPPLAELPKTGRSEQGGWLILTGLAVLSAAFVLTRPKSAKNNNNPKTS